MRGIASFSLAALGIAVLGCSPARAQRAFDWHGAVAAGQTVRVYSVDGPITVRPSADGVARVHAVARSGSGSDTIRYTATTAGGGVRICALRANASCDDNGVRSGGGSGWRRRSRADITVEVPRGVAVRISSGNGDLAVSGATALVHASTGNGDVRVGAGAAEVNASTGNGAVRVDGAAGRISASTGNGRVNVAGAGEGVTASTGNGEIDVALAAGNTRGDLELSTGNGSVTVALPASFSGRVEASTGSGGVESELPIQVRGHLSHSRLQGTIGSGARRLHASSGNGSIRLRRAP